MINISEKYNFLFIHIHKCAGTSIERFFGYNYEDNNFYIEKYFEHLGYYKHLTLNDYEKILSPEAVKKIFKFTIIRNPFDLTVSKYNFSIKNEKVYWNGRNDYEYKKSISFNDYVKYVYNTSLDTTPQNKRDEVSSFDYFIETSTNKMDFIIRFENLHNDFKIICDILNITDKKLSHEFKSDKNLINYKDYYDNESKDLIYKMFGNELIKYNYDF